MSYLSAQVWIGTAFSVQRGLSGRDTAFRLTGPAQLLWVEYKTPAPLPWDTLWIVLRTPEKIQGAFRLYRVKNAPLIYRGQIRVRTASIYLALIMPPRQYRQILKQKRFYVTDADHPTIASLRVKAQTQIAQNQTATAPMEITIDDLEPPAEALLNPPSNPADEKIEELSLDDEALEIEIPDLDESSPEEENFELDDFGDLEDL